MPDVPLDPKYTLCLLCSIPGLLELTCVRSNKTSTNFGHMQLCFQPASYIARIFHHAGRQSRPTSTLKFSRASFVHTRFPLLPAHRIFSSHSPPWWPSRVWPRSSNCTIGLRSIPNLFPTYSEALLALFTTLAAFAGLLMQNKLHYPAEARLQVTFDSRTRFSRSTCYTGSLNGPFDAEAITLSSSGHTSSRFQPNHKLCSLCSPRQLSGVAF